MALLYRAIWEDSRSNLLESAAATTLDWLRSKGVELEDLPSDTEVDGTFRHPRFGTSATYRLTVNQVANEGVEALRISFGEDRADEGQKWTTILTALSESGPVGTLWVDVERFSDDPFKYIPFRAPNLVKSLLENATDARVGHVRLEPRAVVIPVRSLAGLVRNEERRLPIIVFSHDPRVGAEITMRRAQAAYDHLAGVAQVFLLPESDVSTFKDVMGEELAVWGGGARLYLPNRGQGGLRPQRHRYIPAQRVARYTKAAAETFVNMLATTVPATLAPESYEKVRTALFTAGSSDADELLSLALDENQLLYDENAALRISLDQANDANDELGSEHDDLARELNRVRAHLAQVLRDLGTGGASGDIDIEELPNEVATIGEAIDLAETLPNVHVPDEALVDIERLESAPTASAWANHVWRALRALNAYGSNPGRAGFWEFCKDGDSAWTWPASPKKLSMTESEGVQNNPRLRSARMLPVSTKVARSGKIEMLAHIKIAEGGGPMAPRIYFHDDARGTTRAIHIGFIGPHDHMPNLSTN